MTMHLSKVEAARLGLQYDHVEYITRPVPPTTYFVFEDTGPSSDPIKTTSSYEAVITDSTLYKRLCEVVANLDQIKKTINRI